MNSHYHAVGFAVAAGIIALGIWMMPATLRSRIAPGLTVAGQAFGGLRVVDAEGALGQMEPLLLSNTITVTLNGVTKSYQLHELGASLDRAATVDTLEMVSMPGSWLERPQVAPSITFPDDQAATRLHQDLAPQLQLPQNASLQIRGTTATLVPSKPGQVIDIAALEQELADAVRTNAYSAPIQLRIISAAPEIQDTEVSAAQNLVQQLLVDGFVLTFEDKQFTILPGVVQRLVTFVPQPDRLRAGNEVLGLTFNETALEQYLTTTIAPEVDQPAVNARFTMNEGRVEQFALPQRGQTVDVVATIRHINQALAGNTRTAQLAVAVAEPDISDTTAIDNLGVTTLLAQGVSDFVGSPRNRIHNITVGAAKYHGLLIAPNEEFSFLKYLGPVDAANGFKPELVIKTNVTVPEFGGGLCQVSSTAFRAAVNSGLTITERRNHSYAVRYYGTPGFDATIYPPYTDLRFLNTTPGYILIQTRIEGTKLIFDFWGTNDGRTVEVDGPHPYARQANGAVKATLTQTVRKNGEVLVEDTFYSNYKSPDLFPKVLSANGERPQTNVTPTPTPSPPTQNQKPSPTPTPKKVSPTPDPT